MRATFAAIFIVAMACGETPPPRTEAIHEAPNETSVTGNVGGAPFVARSAAARSGGDQTDGGPRVYPGLTVRILESTGACDDLNRHRQSGKSLRFFIINPVDTSQIAAGTYAILGSGEKATRVFAMASVHAWGQCRDTTVETTEQGSVTLTDVGDVVRGTFDVTFATHDGTTEHVTGRFAAPRCAQADIDAGACTQ